MNSFFISVITFLALLFPLVVIHEFGHFFTARLMKVKVLEFGFGFPPKLYSFWTGKTKIIIDEKTEYSDGEKVVLRKGKIVEVTFERTIEGIHANSINKQNFSKELEKVQNENSILTGKISEIEDHQIIIKDIMKID